MLFLACIYGGDKAHHLDSNCWHVAADFNLSTAQKEHASTVEHLVPSLADMRHTSCNHLSEEKFWMIYFIFLLPRLHEQDAKLLSTPEARLSLRVILYFCNSPSLSLHAV